MILVTKQFQEWWARKQVKANPDSHWKHFLALDTKMNWYHQSYIMSIIHALMLSGFAAYSIFQCDPPAEYRSKDQGWFANTMLTNDYCVDNANGWQLFSVLFFLGYLFADMYNCIVNI